MRAKVDAWARGRDDWELYGASEKLLADSLCDDASKAEKSREAYIFVMQELARREEQAR